MSISSAPSATAARVSASLTASGACPDGNAVATLATRTPEDATARTAVTTMDGYTHTAATDGQDGSVGSGRRALAHSARTLPGVSAPSSVVRSTIRMARSMPHALAVVLIDRGASPAPRASAPTRSTPGRPCRNARNVAVEPPRSGIVVTTRPRYGGPRVRTGSGTSPGPDTGDRAA